MRSIVGVRMPVPVPRLHVYFFIAFLTWALWILSSLSVLISAVLPVGAFGAYVASSVALVIVGRSLY